MSDAEALDWLDRLLSADDATRAASLDTLATQNPALHARLERLLASALAPENTRVLAGPVLESVARLNLHVTPAGGEVLAGYRLLRELGRGGMSVVWLAERADGSVKRTVALKMPLFMLQGAVEAERFTRERDALALLGHPNVARLYDAGVLPQGQPFIVLEHIAGEPLNVYCDSRELDLAARLGLFLQVLAAVEHAHKHLIVHRDLKPSNILVDGEGQVKLLDFGIAKLLAVTEGAALTQQIGGALTPSYAAPEQMRGAAISTLTDVFSLGVVLYELLSGALPYRGVDGARATLSEILETFKYGALPRPGDAPLADDAARARGFSSAARLKGALAGDLETMVGKAVRIDPEQRYASAAHFADDVRRYLGKKPLAARPPGVWYVLRLAAVRHRIASTVAAIGLCFVAAASVVAWQQFRESRAHAMRTAAVRDFMFDLVNDAEASEDQQGDVTGRQMIDGAVRRARRDFGAQPQLQGELLGELGRMHLRLGAPESAIPVLEQAIAVLAKYAPVDDPALNKARTFLADALLRTGNDLPRIRALATQARNDCSNDSDDCAKARAYASSALSELASFAGDDEAALTHMRRSAADTERAFGADHEETALAFMSLAVTARNAGHLAEAGEVMSRAVKLSAGQRMRAADRIILERNMAVIDLDLGRYSAARDRLLSLVTQSTNPGEVALLWRLLATVHVELGDSARAQEAVAKAIALIPKDEEAAELPYALQARARAFALAGRFDAALADLEMAIRQFLAGGRSPAAFEVLRAERYRAETLLQAGRDADALTALRSLERRLSATAYSPIERGLTLDALGEAERRAGNGKTSQLAHAAAAAELVKQLPKEHPYLIRNAALRNGAG